MSTLNFLVYLNASSDTQCKIPGNNPSLSNFKWSREASGLSVSNPSSFAFSLAPGETKSLFSGIRTLTQDGTTQYSIALKPANTSIYVLSWTGGTAPSFRTSRTSGADATTAVTVTVNGPVVTFASTGGTPLNLIAGGVVVGDFVRIGTLFSASNQGEWQIISLTATSFSVANELGIAEGPIVLGAGFANQVRIYSAAGVQVGDTLLINSGFSPVTQGSYIITSVADTFLEFSSTDVLPAEGPITTQVAIYSAAKRLVYLEADQHVNMILNGVAGNEINPLMDADCCAANIGIFIRTSLIYSMTVTNVSLSPASLFFASVE